MKKFNCYAQWFIFMIGFGLIFMGAIITMSGVPEGTKILLIGIGAILVDVVYVALT